MKSLEMPALLELDVPYIGVLRAMAVQWRTWRVSGISAKCEYKLFVLTARSKTEVMGFF